MKKQYIASILLLIVVVDVYVARCNGQYMCYDSTSWQTNGIYWTRFYDPEGDVGAYFQDYGYTMGEENCKRLETLGYSCDSSATIIGELDGCTCATLHGHGNSNALALEYYLPDPDGHQAAVNSAAAQGFTDDAHSGQRDRLIALANSLSSASRTTCRRTSSRASPASF